VAPTRAAPPPENFGAAASRIFDGAPTAPARSQPKTVRRRG